MKVVYPGSFNPPTLGHLDIIRRAAGMFDEVVVAVLSQREKHYDLAPAERLDLLRSLTAEWENVRLVSSDGLLADVVRDEKADCILRSVRGESDLFYEMQLADVNKHLCGAETLFLSTSPQYSLISSTIVRDCASHGAPIDNLVPEDIIPAIMAAYNISKRKGS